MLYLFYRPEPDKWRYADDRTRALGRIVDYDVREEARKIEAQFADPAGAFNVQRLDGEMDSWNDIVTACSVLPFFTSHQVVRVRGLIATSSRRRSKDDDKDEDGATGDGILTRTKRRQTKSSDDPTKPGTSADSLAALVASLPETTVLILEEGVLSDKNPYIQKLKALTVPSEVQITSLRPLVDATRSNWIRKQVEQRGGAIDNTAAALLAQQLTDSLWAVSNAIDTLIAYAGPEGRITKDAVTTLIIPDEHSNVFELTDAIANRQAASALVLLHSVLAERMLVLPPDKAALSVLNNPLIGQFRNWTLAKACNADKVSENDTLALLGWPPNTYRMAMRNAAKFGHGELPRAYQTLVVADEILKSRQDEYSLILDMLILTLATRGDPTALREMFPIVAV